MTTLTQDVVADLRRRVAELEHGVCELFPTGGGFRAAISRKRAATPRSDVRFGSRLCENPIDAMIPLLNRGGLMKGFVQGADRQQTTLLPECLDDWVDESNPVRAVR